MKKRTWRESADDECRAPSGWTGHGACDDGGGDPPADPPPKDDPPADPPKPDAEPPAPPAPPAPPKPPKDDPPADPPKPDAPDVSAELAAIRAERAAAEKARQEMEAIVKRNRDAERLKTLRAMRARPELADAHLLALAPDVDASTADGRRALSEWADSEANRGLFLAPETPAVPDRKSYVESLKVDNNPLFGRAYAERIVGKNFGGR